MNNNRECYNLPQQVQKQRKKAHLTQTDLSKLLGVTQVTVSRWETGVATPRADQISRLFDILGLTVSEKVEVENVVNGVQAAVPELNSCPDDTDWAKEDYDD